MRIFSKMTHLTLDYSYFEQKRKTRVNFKNMNNGLIIFRNFFLTKNKINYV